MSPSTTAGGGALRRAEAIEHRIIEKRVLLAQTQEDLSHLEAQLHAWRAGAEGERRVAAVLDALAAEGWVLLHDVHWPGRPKANLDHVAVGPGGVVVVDAKNWSSEASLHDGVLNVGGYRKHAECEAAARMAADVASLLAPQHRRSVRSAICLVGDAASTGTARSGAEVVTAAGLVPWMRDLPEALGPADVRVVSQQLEQQLAGRTSPRVLKTSAVAPSPRGPAGRRPAGRRLGGQRPRRRSAAAARRGAAVAVLTLGTAVGGLLGLSAYLQSLG